MEKYSNYIKKYYDSKKTIAREEYFKFNGKIEGEYKSYWYTGQINLLCNYINGKKHGEYKLYNIHGKLFLIMNYINNNVQNFITVKQ